MSIVCTINQTNPALSTAKQHPISYSTRLSLVIGSLDSSLPELALSQDQVIGSLHEWVGPTD